MCDTRLVTKIKINLYGLVQLKIPFNTHKTPNLFKENDKVDVTQDRSQVNIKSFTGEGESPVRNTT